MKTSLKCASPEIWRSGRTLTPSASIGSTNIVSPRCLGTSGIGAREQQPVGGVLGVRGPDLLARDGPAAVVVALGARLDAGEVGARGGLGEQLAPDVLAGQHRPEVALLLVLGAVRDQRRAEHADADHVEQPGHARAPDLLVDDDLVQRPEPLPAVVGRPGDRREPGARELALPLAVRGDGLHVLAAAPLRRLVCVLVEPGADLRPVLRQLGRVVQVHARTLSGAWHPVVPMPGGFAALPPTVERLLAGTPGGLPHALLGDAPERIDRVAVVLLDAFGMRFVERHADHPLLRGLHVAPLASQFPSTTTAHVTTMHTGTPVGAHGLYEWNVYEPALDAVIIPILYARAGRSAGRAARLRRRDRRHRPARHAVRAPGRGGRALGRAAARPRSRPRPTTRPRLRGAELRPYATIADGAAGLAEALRGARLRLPVLARDRRHRPPRGPGLARVRRRLPAGARRAARGAGARPARPRSCCSPPTTARSPSTRPASTTSTTSCRRSAATSRTAPAGSARDVFLHARPGWRPSWRGELRERLGRPRRGRAGRRARGARPVRRGRAAAAGAARRRLRAARGGPDGVAAVGARASSSASAATTAGWTRRSARRGSGLWCGHEPARRDRPRRHEDPGGGRRRALRGARRRPRADPDRRRPAGRRRRDGRRRCARPRTATATPSRSASARPA